nr:alpha/beta hydrolase [Oscillospiraceae bacterium]
MKIEEYGKENKSTIVMLHGANFVHCYGRQYVLSDRYHIIVPHIMGFGDEAGRTFETEACIKEFAEYIKGLDKKVLLVGFSLGAQLAFKLVSEYEELFYAAIIVSPWLDKDETKVQEIMLINEKQYASFKKKWLCNLIGMMNGLPSKQRKEFVEQMQNVKLETIRNSVDNGISFSSAPSFSEVSVPIIALAGGKEQQDVRESVKKMSELN